MSTTAPNEPPPVTETELFLKLWGGQKLTATLARHLLKMKWADDDLEAMRSLTAKNSAGTITPTELQQLDTYLRVGTSLSILQSRARKFLKRHATANGEHA